jgi:hypothetical protein
MAVDIWQRWTSSWQELTRHEQQYDDKLASAESDCEMSCAFCWAVGYSPQAAQWGSGLGSSGRRLCSCRTPWIELKALADPVAAATKRRGAAHAPRRWEPLRLLGERNACQSCTLFLLCGNTATYVFWWFNFFIKKLWYNHSKEHVGLWVNSDYLTRHSWVYTHLFSSVQ